MNAQKARRSLASVGHMAGENFTRMKMDPRIYLVTYYEFNHHLSQNKKAQPLDDRFLKEKDRYVYYLIDKKVPEVLKGQPVLFEHEIDETLYAAGGKHLGEWSFLLAEAKYGFCQYPFFMISSRFYQKNHWLERDLNQEWDRLFGYFKDYGWGYLPSYDRPMRWINLSWEKYIKKEAWRYLFFPFTEKTYELTQEIFDVNIPRDYGYTADLFCNYIGFRSRTELLEYVNFYKPLIEYFFDSEYRPKRDISPYIRSHGGFRNEKAFTFLLELLSHLFFFKKNQKYFALHYDGYYSVDERNKNMVRLEKIKTPILKKTNQLLRWQYRRMRTEGCLAKLRWKVRNLLGRA